jgi:Zn-dependent M28 family amino/carboxypeptidase
MTNRSGSSRRVPVRIALVAVLGLLLSALVAVPAAVAAPGEACDRRTNNTYQKLLECVTLEGVREHQAQFQKIADSNDDPFYPGTRAAGTEGYADSVDYVAGLLRAAGYEVTLDEFQFQFVFPALLQQLTPINAVYETGAFTGSGAGDVTGNVIPVDINLTGTRATTSGCEASDFAGLDFSGPNDIALIQRGGPPAPAPVCTFAVKAVNAQAAGAEAVIIFNQGNTPDREPLIVGTLVPSPAPITIPVVGASFADGVALAQPGSTARVRVIPSETRTDVNVIAELPGKNADNVVMTGAHLDSVTAGPGINDNGSGSAALLETALMIAKVKPENTLRFAWWGAEELGLIGSTAYVQGLSQAERDQISLYLNYDMVGSPNYIFMIYDADQSTFPAPAGVPIPAGSTAIEDLYESYYTLIGEPYDDTLFSGRSDYQAFIAAGIPSGGLFTGAEVVKTPEQEAIWGGTAGQQFDPCYHQACDTIDNVSLHALEVNSDLIAFAQLTFAYSTESVNGVPGKKVPGPPLNLPPPAGPEGTFAAPDGGGGPGPIES